MQDDGFRLLETLLWRSKSGFFLEQRHLDRLLGSARHFGWKLEETVVRDHLASAERRFRAGTSPPARPLRKRVRLLADRYGEIELQATDWPCAGRQTWTLAVDDRPVDSTDDFLRHKTTRRQVYDDALARHPDADDVLLWNERRELTESTRANLVVKVDGSWLTPALLSGLLPGTYRAELLARGRLQEAVMLRDLLYAADEVFLINSVRGFIRARVV